jgi:hypothetical protein
MLVMLLLNVIVLFLGAFFSFFPTVDTLPLIVGYDIDGALVSGVGQLHSFFATFWYLGVLFQGFLALMVYYAGKMIVRVFFGSRAPD